MNIIKNKNGYAILELLFYVSFFAVFSLVVINSMIIMASAFRETTIQGELLQSGSIIEKIGREIRQASSVSSISSSSLRLNTTDDAGVAKTVEFVLSGANVQFFENDVLTGNLNTPNILVSTLSFTQVTTANSTAVRVSLILSSSNDALGRAVDFFDTVVLRGSY